MGAHSNSIPSDVSQKGWFIGLGTLLSISLSVNAVLILVIQIGLVQPIR